MWSTVAEGMQQKQETVAAIEWQRGVNNVYVKQNVPWLQKLSRKKKVTSAWIATAKGLTGVKPCEANKLRNQDYLDFWKDLCCW